MFGIYHGSAFVWCLTDFGVLEYLRLVERIPSTPKQVPSFSDAGVLAETACGSPASGMCSKVHGASSRSPKEARRQASRCLYAVHTECLFRIPILWGSQRRLHDLGPPETKPWSAGKIVHRIEYRELQKSLWVS